jgi:hypothetical protein
MPHDAADVTNREAAKDWGRGRPCAHHQQRGDCILPQRPAETGLGPSPFSSPVHGGGLGPFVP